MTNSFFALIILIFGFSLLRAGDFHISGNKDIDRDRLCLDAANSKLYSLDRKNGSMLRDTRLSVWVRSRPVVMEGLVHTVK